MLLMILSCLALGTVAGFFAGLFGIGAGILMVAVLDELFVAQGIPADLALRVALGTSMAGVVFNSLASLRAHHRHGAVLWPVVGRITPGIVVGTLAGTQLAAVLPVRQLAFFFIAFLLFIAAQMALELKPAGRRSLPGGMAVTVVGAAIGVVMSLIAGGGGMLSIPFLVWCNVDIRKAIGSAAAIGFPIAVSGTIGYIIAGWGDPALPDWSLGHVYLPALAATVVASSVTAPIGANMAHRLPVRSLRRGFALFLLLVAARMAYRTFF